VNWWTFCHGLLCYCMVFSLLLSLYFVRFCFEGSIEKSNTMTGKSVGLDFRFALQSATGNH
jgi:hypothetical protein